MATMTSEQAEVLRRAVEEFGYLCGDCDTSERPVDVDCFEQRGEPICTFCADHGAYAAN
jgi:hypothetical protein